MEKLLDATLSPSFSFGCVCRNDGVADAADMLELKRKSVGAESVSLCRPSSGLPASAEVCLSCAVLVVVVPSCADTSPAAAPPSGYQLVGDSNVGAGPPASLWRTSLWAPVLGAACPLTFMLEDEALPGDSLRSARLVRIDSAPLPLRSRLCFSEVFRPLFFFFCFPVRKGDERPGIALPCSTFPTCNHVAFMTLGALDFFRVVFHSAGRVCWGE